MITIKDIKFKKERQYLKNFTKLDVSEGTTEINNCFNEGYLTHTQAVITAETKCTAECLSKTFNHQARLIIDTIYGDIRNLLGELQFKIEVGDQDGASEIVNKLTNLIEKSYKE